MTHRELCDLRMFLTSTLENNSWKGERWRHSIWSSTWHTKWPPLKDFLFPCFSRAWLGFLTKPSELAWFWWSRCHILAVIFLARLAPAHAKTKLNSISSRILRFYTCFVKQKITQTHFNLLCLFFQRLSKFWGRTSWSETYSKSFM